MKDIYNQVLEIPTDTDSDLREFRFFVPDGYDATFNDGMLIIRKKKLKLSKFEQEVRCILRTHPVVLEKADSEAVRVAAQLRSLVKEEFSRDAEKSESDKRFEKVYPEYRNYIDEKVRQRLITFVLLSPDAFFTNPDPTRAQCLAWLEKQKDNKSAPRVLPCSAAWFEDDEEKQKEQKPD